MEINFLWSQLSYVQFPSPSLNDHAACFIHKDSAKALVYFRSMARISKSTTGPGHGFCICDCESVEKFKKLKEKGR